MDKKTIIRIKTNKFNVDYDNFIKCPKCKTYWAKWYIKAVKNCPECDYKFKEEL